MNKVDKEEDKPTDLFMFTKQMIQHFEPELGAKIVYYLNTLM